MLDRTIRYFDRLEDKTRKKLSRYPIVYALVGAVGIVLLWKGVWEIAESIPVLHGVGSLLLGLILLLSTGLLVSFFVGQDIIISGVKGEKKLVEKTEQEVRSEEESISYLVAQVERMREKLDILEQERFRR